MKKLLYLFLALFIVACSDDDRIITELFMEKYDNVVWIEIIDYSSTIENKITFSAALPGFIAFNDDYGYGEECINYTFGEQIESTDEDEDGNEIIIGYGSYTIQSELEDSIVLYLELNDTNGVTILTGTATFTVSSGGNAAQFAFVYDGDASSSNFTHNYTIAPDEFPCN